VLDLSEHALLDHEDGANGSHRGLAAEAILYMSGQGWDLGTHCYLDQAILKFPFQKYLLVKSWICVDSNASKCVLLYI
jgi:hypothetical protein